MIIFGLAIIATVIHFHGKWKGKEFIGMRSILAGGLSLACIEQLGDNLFILIFSIILLIFNVVLHMTPSKVEYKYIQEKRSWKKK